MVSLLVSFTLTPMMSARLLRREDALAGRAMGNISGPVFTPGSIAAIHGSWRWRCAIEWSSVFWRWR